MIRDPSLDAKYFCSSTNRICELTKLTPGTARAVSFSFIRNAILVSSGTSNGSRLMALVQVVTTLSALASTTLRVASTALALGDRDGLLGGGPRRAGFDQVGRREAPRAVDQHAQAEAVARRARHVLHLPLARRDRFAAIAVDADVGVGGAELRGARQRGVGDLGSPLVVGRTGLEGTAQSGTQVAARTALPAAMNSRRDGLIGAIIPISPVESDLARWRGGC